MPLVHGSLPVIQRQLNLPANIEHLEGADGQDPECERLHAERDAEEEGVGTVRDEDQNPQEPPGLAHLELHVSSCLTGAGSIALGPVIIGGVNLVGVVQRVNAVSYQRRQAAHRCKHAAHNYTPLALVQLKSKCTLNMRERDPDQTNVVFEHETGGRRGRLLALLGRL